MKRGPKFVATLVAVALAAVLAALDQTVVATALPHIIGELQGATILGWVFTAYFLAATATVTVAGKLADLFGRRDVFMISIAIFLAGSLLCGLATNMPMLVLFRAVQGVGAGSINTMSFIVMADLFSARERGKWQAVNNIGFATASAIGPSIGGVVSDNVSWRWIFLINVPLCLVTLAVVAYGLQQTARTVGRRTRDIDWAGALWSTVGVTAILLALTWGGRDYAWTSPQLVSLLAVTLVAGLLLWRAERRASDPLIPAGIWSGGVVPFVCIGFFAMFFVWFTMILLAPLRLQLVLGATATEAGALLTPGIVSSSLCAFVGGQILSRTGRYRPLCRGGAVLQVLGLAMLVYVPTGMAELWILFSFAVVGVGTGLAIPPMMIAFQNAIPHRKLGAGMGLVSLFRQFGSSVGTTVIGAIVGASAAVATVPEMESSIQQAVLVQLGAGVVALVTAWLIADLPLGTTRGPLDIEARGSPVDGVARGERMTSIP
jgi:EmrB/QacA subfamily drug resistance transporter